ncbi:MAG TPA: Crp/Fnr family transcriptional regulator [Gaiellaceae bacterium]|jgi:CRP-like cAMP-binding protein|nr:Crp/Fnr family transcriptional regulator [Gaiellaceae bacterium]
MLGGELFKHLPEPELRRLVAIARRRRFARSEVVFHRDDPADTLHLIVRGYFAARLETRLGDTVTTAVHGPGDAFGELALLDSEQSRSTTVAALSAAETYAVRRDDFSRLRREYPEVNDVLARLLAQRLRRTTELLTEALFVSAELRVVRRLAELAALYGGRAPNTVVPLAQHELAELAGTSRATVNRVLGAETQEGTVSLGRNRITVVDPDRLAARAARGDTV